MNSLSGRLLVGPVHLVRCPIWSRRSCGVWEGHQADQCHEVAFLQRHPADMGDVQPEGAVIHVLKNERDDRQDKEGLWVFFRDVYKKSTNTAFRPE